MADTIDTLITGIENSKSDIATAITNKGVTVPSGTKLAGMANLINSIPVGTGDVVGPSSSVDGNLAAFDGTTGKLLKDSGIASSSVALDSDVVHKGTSSSSVDETIYGTKTFNSQIMSGNGIKGVGSNPRLDPGYFDLTRNSLLINGIANNVGSSSTLSGSSLTIYNQTSITKYYQAVYGRSNIVLTDGSPLQSTPSHTYTLTLPSKTDTLATLGDVGVIGNVTLSNPSNGQLKVTTSNSTTPCLYFNKMTVGNYEGNGISLGGGDNEINFSAANGTKNSLWFGFRKLNSSDTAINTWIFGASTNSDAYGTIHCQTVTQHSDARAKENIDTPKIENYTELLNKIQLKEFNFKQDKNKTIKLGVIAQELEQIVPERYHDSFIYATPTKDGNDNILSIDPASILFLAIGTIQEQNKKIKELEDKIKELEAK